MNNEIFFMIIWTDLWFTTHSNTYVNFWSEYPSPGGYVLSFRFLKTLEFSSFFSRNICPNPDVGPENKSIHPCSKMTHRWSFEVIDEQSISVSKSLG